MKTKLLYLLLSLLPILLVGCVSYSEETWFNTNGSGKMTMEISAPEQFIAMMAEQNSADPFSQEAIAKPFKGNKGIKLGEVKTYNQDGNRITVLNFEFSSLEALGNVKNENGEAPGYLSKITFTENKKGQLVFTRTLAGTESDGTDEVDPSMLSGFNWTYKIHFPSKVINANTANNYIDTKTNTVVWEIPFSSLFKGPQTMTATIATPIPWLIILVSIAGLLVVIVLILITLKLTKKPAKNV